MSENINRKIRESLFYKYHKELLQDIIASYESPEEYHIDKLNDDDLDKIVMELYDDNYFNKLIDQNIQETLEKYAAYKENQENIELGRSN